MTDTLVSYKIALLAKQKGFNEKCYFYYTLGKELQQVRAISDVEYVGYNNEELEIDSCFAVPTQSLLQNWLREKAHCFIMLKLGNDFLWINNISKDELSFSTYEEALEDALFKALYMLVDGPCKIIATIIREE